MAQYTQHYELHQWEPGDSFLRTEFNEDLAKIDGAIKGVETQADAKLAGKCGVVTGTYTGDGTEEREIVLGFRPTVLLLRDGGSGEPAFLTEGAGSIKDRPTGRIMLALTDRGFQVKHATYNNGTSLSTCSPYTNRANIEYSYAAFR